jgi:flagellar hook-associated protein 2
MNILSSLGAGSGIDTRQLVQDLVAAERAPKLARIDSRRELAEARISGLSQLRAGLQAFASALSALTSSGALGTQPRSSAPAAVQLTPTRLDAPPVSLTVEVDQLARPQTLASAAFASPDAAVGTGVLTVTFGELTDDGAGGFASFTADPERAAAALTIGPDDATLAGVMRKINAANIGLAASIIDDGSGARLVVKGADGKESGFKLSVAATNLGDPIEGLAFDAAGSATRLTGIARNAALKVDGLPITRGSNRITDLVDGYTLDIAEAAPGKPVQLSASHDAGELSSALQNYVGAYNELQALIDEVAAPSNGDRAAGPLVSSSAVSALRAELRSLTTAPVLAASSRSSLADLGIASDRSGQLTIDTRRLDAAIAAAPADVGRMFTDAARSSASAVAVLGVPARVAPGSYRLTDIVAATRGSLAGTVVPAAFAAPLVIDATNSAFAVVVDGRASLTLNLPEASYTTGADFAAAVEAAINGDSVLRAAGRAVDVDWAADTLRITSRSLGSTSTVAITSLEPALQAALGLDSPAVVAGTNAAGKIDGIDAIAIAERLSAPIGSPGYGLQLRVDGDVAAADISITHGIGTRLEAIASKLGRPGGALSRAIAAVEREQSQLTEEAVRIDARAATLEEQLTRRFAAMEAALSAYRSTQTFLDQQIELWAAAAGRR